MKRSRGDGVDRDGAEVQLRRIGQRHTRNTNWRGATGRKEPEHGTETFHQDPSCVTMEFDIQREMVGAVIGKGGSTVRSIRSRTGASVHVHSFPTENARTYVEIRGRREQIQTAFDELRAVVGSVDEEFAKQMHASVTVKTKPESVGCLIGKQGQNIKQIEEETRARVRVEPHEEGEEFQCVYVSGDVGAVEMATRMVQDSLERYDASRGKKQFPPQHVQRMQMPGQPQALPQQQQQPIEPKAPPPPQEAPPGQTEAAPSVPPILIQAPAGGFGTQPAILVLQADGTYHAAQLVTAVDGGLNPAGLVSVVNAQAAAAAAIPGYLPPTPSQPLDASAGAPQRVQPTAYSQQQQQNTMQQQQQQATAAALMQQMASNPMTQPTVAAPVESYTYPQQQQQQQQFSPQMYNLTAVSGAMPNLSSSYATTQTAMTTEQGQQQHQNSATSMSHALHSMAPPVSSSYPSSAPRD